MQILAYLIPISLILGGVGLVGFIYTLRSDQYDDSSGNAQRILSNDWDDRPKP